MWSFRLEALFGLIICVGIVAGAVDLFGWKSILIFGAGAALVLVASWATER